MSSAAEGFGGVMIPTRHKAKLPEALSWPLGAAAITAGLGDAPHVADLSLWFTDGVAHPAAAFQRVVRECLPYTLLVAEYRPAARPGYIGTMLLADELRRYEAKWELHVSPVPGPWRAAAGAALRDAGLHAVAEWLRSSVRAGWELRRHRLALVFVPATGTLALQAADGV